MKVMSSVSTAFKVHYNQKLGGPIRPSWGGDAPWPLGGIDAHKVHTPILTSHVSSVSLHSLTGSYITYLLEQNLVYAD